LEYRAGNYISRIDLKESKKGLISEELLQKARGISRMIYILYESVGRII